MNKAINYYHGEKEPSARAAFDLLSKEAQAETSFEDFARQNNRNPKVEWAIRLKKGTPKETYDDFLKEWNSSRFSPTNAKVVHQETIGNRDYVAVQIDYLTPDGKTRNTSTATWIKEGKFWHRHGVHRTADQASQLYDQGRYNEALDKALSALQVDPFSMDAFNTIAFSIARGGSVNQDSFRRALVASGSDSTEVARGDAIRASGAVNEKLVTELIQRMLSVSPDDATANFVALTFAKDPMLAKPFLDRLRGTHTFSTALVNFSSKLPPIEVLKLLQAEADTDDQLIKMKLVAFCNLGKWEECRSCLNSVNVKKTLLDGIRPIDPKHTARYVQAIGLSSIACGEIEYAREVLTKGAVVASGQASLDDLVACLKQPDPVVYARRRFGHDGTGSTVPTE